MKEFSLVVNDGNSHPELPAGLILVFGNRRGAVVYTDYDGKTNRPQPEGIEGEWFPLAKDFDSVMAWHGERKTVKNVVHGKVNWRKRR